MDPSAGYLKEYQKFSFQASYGSTKRWRKMATDGLHDQGVVLVGGAGPSGWRIEQKEFQNQRLKNEQSLKQLETLQAKQYKQFRAEEINNLKAYNSQLENKERRCEILIALENEGAEMSKERKDSLEKELAEINKTLKTNEDEEGNENNETPQEQRE